MSRPQQGDNHEGFPRRTSKLEILWRISIVPLMVVAFWTFMLSLGGNGEIVRWTLIGGLGTLAGLLGFLWGFVNFDDGPDNAEGVVVNQKGRGRPLVYSLPSPFNDDPAEVRYQELFREKLRQENERLLQPLVPQRNDPNDATRSIDDPDII